MIKHRLFAVALLALAAVTAPQLDVRYDSSRYELSFDVGYSEASAATSNVSCSATNVTLVSANGARRNLLIFNDADQAVDVKYGATATTSSYTVQIAAQGYWEMAPMPVYTGRIDAIWEAACSGAARLTEQ